MDILNSLLLQLKQIEGKYKKSIEDNLLTYDYYVFEIDYKFLDVNELRNFITTTKVENLAVFREVYNICLNIVELWNCKLCKLPEKKLKDGFSFSNSNSFGNTSTDFYAVVLQKENEGGLQFWSGLSIKQRLCNELEFKTFNVASIAKRCGTIMNWISASYPEMKETDNDFIKGEINITTIFLGTKPMHYDVVKNSQIRKYTIDRYYDLHLQNWEDLIDSLRTTKEELNTVNNAIFEYQKEMYNEAIPEIRERINKNIEHLKNIKEYIESTPSEDSAPSQKNAKYRAKHYVLAYLFECNAKGESFPIGKKTEIEKIGNSRIGAGKGNTFYKVFNNVVYKDLNCEDNLIEIGGEDWRKAIKELTNIPELVEQYLQSKQL